MSTRPRYIDADTGNYITTIIRKGIPYMILRDKKTGRIIKFLKNIEIRSIASVEYGEEVARKKNPIYVDAVSKSLIGIDEFIDIDHTIAIMEDTVLRVIEAYFGRYVEALAKVRGIELGTHITTSSTWQARESSYTIIWKHHKGSEPRQAKGYTNLLRHVRK